MQYVIKYVALAVALHQSVVLTDGTLSRAAWVLSSRKFDGFHQQLRKRASCYICSIAWAVYFAL